MLFSGGASCSSCHACRYEDVGQLQLLRRNHQGENSASASSGNGVSPGHINNLVLAPPAVTQAPSQVRDLIISQRLLPLLS